MAGPTAREPGFFRTHIDGAPVLPALCPLCGTSASRADSVPIFGSTPGDASELTVYFCELCADARERRRTTHLAWQIAAALLGIGGATTLALYFGSHARLTQGLLTASLATLPALAGLFLDRHHLEAPVVGSDPPRITFAGPRRDYVAALGPLEVISPPQQALLPTLQRHLALPLLSSLLFLLLLHAWGTARIVALQAELEPAVLLVDHRRRALVPPTPEERPGAVTSLRTLAGRRHLGLLSTEGSALADQVETLWPGRTYLLAHPPPGLCFFLEVQEYGAKGAAHFLQPLYGEAPLWELPADIDRWLAPPPERPNLPTTGGIRRALRLLPCRDPPLAAGIR